MYDIDRVKLFDSEMDMSKAKKSGGVTTEKSTETATTETKSKKSSSSSSESDSYKKNISFEEYCKLWKGIATTKASKEEENVYVASSLLNKPHLLPQHVSISLQELEEHINKQLNQHKQLMYGKFHFPSLEASNQGSKHSRTDRNRAINYNALKSTKSFLASDASSQQAAAAEATEKNSHEDSHEHLDSPLIDDRFEQEVSELISWTKTI